ncbi:cytochrome o ubiquinol oxidase subunit IV [Sulfobacillus harzensis]|uniref:Cytochrome C oxidase subunit IV n=1 Tax=Sulfobacillus harzensis TaxID=2729629 RepID=A0A7Y0L4Q1_9FIRM|nr:cytochrome C oxidase subunit IV family protein [Sulfobacillus harzensis]NMP23273.1 cytochrome C oxidase subunit IV [Sulfobacillus harzensis]
MDDYQVHHPDAPSGHGDEVELGFLAPRFHTARFPGMQVAGYILSLILTLIAFGMVAYHWLPLSALVTVIIIIALIQGALQLGIFMHLREARGTIWHLPVLGLALFIGLGIVAFSIWIMLFKSGVS